MGWGWSPGCRVWYSPWFLASTGVSERLPFGRGAVAGLLHGKPWDPGDEQLHGNPDYKGMKLDSWRAG